MWLAGRLFRRLRNGARIIHQDGRITKCFVIPYDPTVTPPFGYERVMTIVVPPGVVARKENQLHIDWKPRNTAVRVAIQEGHLRA